MKKTVDIFGRLDVVVNNAGYAIYGSLEELSEQEFRQSAEVNVFGTVNTIRNAMPYLRKQRSGHIINIASSGGYRGYGSAGAYAAVKFAVIGLSESLAEEVRPLDVKVTVVAPGFFRTSFLDKGKLMVAKNRIAEYNTSAMETWMHEMDGKQPGDPEKLVRLLVSITTKKEPPSPRPGPRRIPVGIGKGERRCNRNGSLEKPDVFYQCRQLGFRSFTFYP